MSFSSRDKSLSLIISVHLFHHLNSRFSSHLPSWWEVKLRGRGVTHSPLITHYHSPLPDHNEWGVMTMFVTRVWSSLHIIPVVCAWCQVWGSPIIGRDIRLLLPGTGITLETQQPVRSETKPKVNQWEALIIVNSLLPGCLAGGHVSRMSLWTLWSVMLTLDTDNLLIKPDINLFHDRLPHRHHWWRFDKALFSVTFWFVYDSALACCLQDWWFLVGSDNSVSPPAIHFILHLLKTF